MGRVLTNNFSLSYSIEASLGTLAGTPTWKTTEPNTVSEAGADIKTVAREPISPLRQRRKGTTVDLDSGIKVQFDLTMSHIEDFIEGFFFASAVNNSNQAPLRSGALFNSLAADDDPPPAGTDSGYTHSALSGAIAAGRLVYVRGFSNSTNNGMKEVKTGSTTTATLITTALVDETPGNSANASLELAGVRGAVGDITLTVSGTTGTLGATTLNFTTLNLTVGQIIHIGGLTTTNQFNNGKGYARITSIAAGALGLDKISSTLVTDTGAGKQIDILFSQFIRNVSSSNASYLERSFQFELAYPNLQVPGPGDMYQYCKGNYASKLEFNLPLTDKASMNVEFIGTDTADPTTSRATNASTPRGVTRSTAFSDSSDIVRLRIQSVAQSDVTSCFKDTKITIDNNVSAEKCLGTLGAVFMNVGNFNIDLDTTVLFTDPAIPIAIKANTTMTMDFVMKNGDGGFAIDIPSLTLQGGGKEFPINESIRIKVPGQAFADAVLGYSMSCSTFAAVP